MSDSDGDTGGKQAGEQEKETKRVKPHAGWQTGGYRRDGAQLSAKLG